MRSRWVTDAVFGFSWRSAQCSCLHNRGSITNWDNQPPCISVCPLHTGRASDWPASSQLSGWKTSVSRISAFLPFPVQTSRIKILWTVPCGRCKHYLECWFLPWSPGIVPQCQSRVLHPSSKFFSRSPAFFLVLLLLQPIPGSLHSTRSCSSFSSLSSSSFSLWVLPVCPRSSSSHISLD